MKYIDSKLKEELDAWLRVESPLTTYARSLRMEGPDDSSDDSTKGSDNKSSLLKGVNMDDLPEDVRDLLLEREKEFNLNLTKTQQLEQEKQQALADARNHQSRADRFHGFIKAHNLDPEQRPPAKKDEDVNIAQLEAGFLEDGLKPEAAKAYAKLFAKAIPVVTNAASKNIANGLAPIAAVVGDLQADSVLAEARTEANDPEGILQIPDILKEVTANLKYLAQAGTPIDLATIENIKYMAYGKALTKNPNIRTPAEPTAIHTRLRGMGGGDVRPPGNRRGDSAPVAANEDTARAVQATTAVMLKGLKLNK